MPEKLTWIGLTAIHLFFRLLSKVTYRFGIAEQSAIKGYHPLLTLAKKQKADFYLVHHAEALAIGYKASRSANARLGFDAEDFQTGMVEGPEGMAEAKLLTFLEHKYLPSCKYFTAASKGIGEAYSKKYNTGPFTTILNVFPKESLKERSFIPPVKFYWYSQVIGPNRSLELLLEAASQLNEPFELHLRGKFNSHQYEASLRETAKNLGIENKVFYHEPILAESIIKDASRYDVGLAIETDISFNRDICVTNKVFSYLMSGLAIVGTDTEGQLDIFSQFKNAVKVCLKNDAGSLSKAMLYFIKNPEQLLQAKLAAKNAANNRYNWEYESSLLLEYLEETLACEDKTIYSLIKNK